MRMMEFGVLHCMQNSEGLNKSQRFVSADSHSFCTEEQLQSEVHRVLKCTHKIFGLLGLEISLEVFTRSGHYYGELSQWIHAETAVTELLQSFKNDTGISYKMRVGYEPNGLQIQILVHDKYGGSICIGSILVDFYFPIRFCLEYMDKEDKLKKPILLHANMMRVERLMTIMSEHCMGKWPFWLSPRQAVVIPVTKKSYEYSIQVWRQLHEAGFHVDFDTSKNTLKKKIFRGYDRGYNVLLVVGEKEMNSNSVSVRARGTDMFKEQFMTVEQLIHAFEQLIQQFK